MDYQTKLKKALERRFVGKKMHCERRYFSIEEVILIKPKFKCDEYNYYPYYNDEYDFIFWVSIENNLFTQLSYNFTLYQHDIIRTDCLKYFNLNPFFASLENIKYILNYDRD